MLSLIPILLNIHLLPLSIDPETTPDAKQVKVTQISSEDDLAIFSENFFDRPFTELTLKNHESAADMAETGLIEGGIFFVYDKSGNTLGVLKAMPTEDAEDVELFEDEYSALESLSRLSFQNFHTINLLGRAQGEVNGEEMLVLAETLAPGKSLNQSIKDYGKMTSAAAKARVIGEIKESLNAIGVALAELHVKSPKSRANEYYLKKCNGYLPGPYGIIHGDAHPGNIFYDHRSGEATFIDFQLTPDLKEGGPVGYDVANLLVTTELMGKYKKIPDEEIKMLNDAFLESYRKNGPELSDKDLHFYKMKMYKRYASIGDGDLAGPDEHQARFVSQYSQKKYDEMVG